MKRVELDLPDRMAEGLEDLVKSGFYADTQDAVRHALNEFLRHHASAMAEAHQREDIAWVLREFDRPSQ